MTRLACWKCSVDRFEHLVGQLDADRQLVHRRFPELDCGPGGRRLLLHGATLLHVAAEFGTLEAAHLLLNRGEHRAAAQTCDEGGGGEVPRGGGEAVCIDRPPERAHPDDHDAMPACSTRRPYFGPK